MILQLRRLGGFEPRRCCAPSLPVEPVQIIEWFVLRWQLEVTFQEARMGYSDLPSAASRLDFPPEKAS